MTPLLQSLLISLPSALVLAAFFAEAITPGSVRLLFWNFSVGRSDGGTPVSPSGREDERERCLHRPFESGGKMHKRQGAGPCDSDQLSHLFPKRNTFAGNPYVATGQIRRPSSDYDTGHTEAALLPANSFGVRVAQMAERWWPHNKSEGEGSNPFMHPFFPARNRRGTRVVKWLLWHSQDGRAGLGLDHNRASYQPARRVASPGARRAL